MKVKKGCETLLSLATSTHLRICPVPEGVKDLLHSHNLARLSVDCFPHDAIGLRHTQKNTGDIKSPPWSRRLTFSQTFTKFELQDVNPVRKCCKVDWGNTDVARNVEILFNSFSSPTIYFSIHF